MTDAGFHVVIRPAEADDFALVFGSWCSSYERYSRLADYVRHYVGQNPTRVIDRIAKRIVERGARVDVASWADDPMVILGWACSEGQVLHYVWVRRDFRGQGIARQLVSPLAVTRVSHVPEGRNYKGLALDLCAAYG